MSTDLLSVPAIELARRVRARELGPVELLEAHLSRIEQVNPHLNAMVVPRFELARQEAQEAEALLARTRESAALPSFFGVPCTIKEFFGVEGMPSTGGIVHHKARVADQDATCVARLRAAGAIVMGLSNVPEGGLWMESYNNIYGRTSNPWDTRRTPGGSSGGEGALIATGASPFGLGSDVGGSIRIPAFMNGVVGHKPSGRLVPNTGQFPGASGEGGAYLSSGPLGRSAKDMMPLLRVLAGPDGVDPVARPFELGDPAQVDLKGLTVYVLGSDGRTIVGREVRDALWQSAQALEARGAQVEVPNLPRLRHAVEIWSAMLGEANEESYDDILGRDGKLKVWRELAAVPFRRSPHTLSALIPAAADRLMRPFQGTIAHWLKEGSLLKHELDGLLDDHAVLLYPPYTRPAPLHWGAWTTPFDFACTAIFNVMELPGTCLPTGQSRKGLPLGIQVLGGQGHDHLTIAVAMALEEHWGQWQPVDPARRGRPLLSQRPGTPPAVG